MNEDFAKRDWSDHHDTMSTGIARALDTIWTALRVLNCKQYESPWKSCAPDGRSSH
jgi:hypothetical protein